MEKSQKIYTSGSEEKHWTKVLVFPLVGDRPISPTTPKIGLGPYVTPVFPQNVDFVIFMQFLIILPKLVPPPTSQNPIWETLLRRAFHMTCTSWVQ